MKRFYVFSFLLVLTVGLAIPCRAATGIVTIITNYFPGYVCTTSDWQTAEDSDLTTGEVYACFLVSDIDHLTVAQADDADATSSIGDLIRAIVEEANEALTDADSANRPTKVVVSKSLTTSSGTADYTETLKIKSELNITTDATESE